MKEHPAYNLTMVFDKTSDWDFEAIRVTGNMLNVLSLLDGKRTLAEVYEKLIITYEDLFSSLQQLHALKLIKTADPETDKTETKLKAAKVKKGFFRGAAFEINM